jgi:hypothetical protein
MGYKGKLSGAQIDALPGAISDLEADVARLITTSQPLIIDSIDDAAFNAGLNNARRIAAEDWDKIVNGGRVVFAFNNMAMCDVISRTITSKTAVVAWLYMVTANGTLELIKVKLDYATDRGIMQFRRA